MSSFYFLCCLYLIILSSYQHFPTNTKYLGRIMLFFCLLYERNCLGFELFVHSMLVELIWSNIFVGEIFKYYSTSLKIIG